MLKSISAVTLTIEAQVGKDDKMFGSVTVKDIAESIIRPGRDGRSPQNPTGSAD